jgi:hypothetical protein
MDTPVKNKLIKIAYENPELRDSLLPLILKQGSLDKKAEFERFAGNLFTSSVSGALATAILMAFLHGAPAEAKERVKGQIKADPAKAVKVLKDKDVQAAKALLEEAGFTVSEKVPEAHAAQVLEEKVEGDSTLSQAAGKVSDFFSGMAQGVKGLFGGPDPTGGMTPIELKYPARGIELFDAGTHYLAKVTGTLKHSPDLAQQAVRLRVQAVVAEDDGGPSGQSRFDYSNLGRPQQVSSGTWTVEIPKMGPKGPANPGVKVQTVHKLNDKVVRTTDRRS